MIAEFDAKRALRIGSSSLRQSGEHHCLNGLGLSDKLLVDVARLGAADDLIVDAGLHRVKRVRTLEAIGGPSNWALEGLERLIKNGDRLTRFPRAEEAITSTRSRGSGSTPACLGSTVKGEGLLQSKERRSLKAANRRDLG